MCLNVREPQWPRAVHRPAIALMFGLVLAACGADEGGPAPAEEAAWGQSPAQCGMPAYAWLPPAQVGLDLSWTEHKLSNLSATTLAAMLVQAGLASPPPLKYGARNFLLRYVTQDRGKAVEATAVVSVPTGLPAGDSAPTLLWLHGTTGLNDSCAPSRDPLGGVGLSALLAAFGYVTVSPDYLGMVGFGAPSPPGALHPYLIGEPTALASLDAVRAAARALAKEAALTQPDLSKLVLMGASQGGHAALFTERFQPHYAPELGLVATAALVPPASLERSARAAVTELGGMAKLIAAMWAAMHQWYKVTAPLDEVLTDAAPWHIATALPGMLTQTCSPDMTVGMVGVADLYASGHRQAIAAGLPPDPWGCMLKENSLTTTSLPRLADRAVLMTYSEKDDLVLPDIERENFNLLCAQGYRLQYRECAGKSHAAGAVAVVPWAMSWLGQRLAGAPLDPAQVCKTAAPIACD